MGSERPTATDKISLERQALGERRASRRNSTGGSSPWTIEASCSKMDLLEAFATFQYPNEIDPGLWDIHSPRAPSTKEMLQLIRAAMSVVSKERLWVNPDCGLKTRR
jgi:methionine synthase II (cobalamin-independent)